MELFNDLPEEREQAVEDFLTFIPIYESKRRFRSLNALLKRNKKLIRGKACLEAGAGRGLFSRSMSELGAEKVIAVERSAALFKVLQSELANVPNAQLHAGDIKEFVPKEQIDLLFHEFYGPLILDETILVLNSLKFEPEVILPDGGRLWAMPISEQQVRDADPYYDPSWKEALSGALISDLLNGIPFQPTWKVFDWKVGDGPDGHLSYEFQMPEGADFLALCGEITHQEKHVLNMWWTHNWPVIYTPVEGSRFRLEFDFDGRFTDILFKWLD
ncbi:MAG TPA: hypothetical protein ENJ82_00905 [Bacteroidetes bacterium]|nr:hypothetical protein [Bacteroidota bacterium]